MSLLEKASLLIQFGKHRFHSEDRLGAFFLGNPPLMCLTSLAMTNAGIHNVSQV